MPVSCECCVLSGRGLCDELVPRPEESYRLWCVQMCVIMKPRRNEEAQAHIRLSSHKRKVHEVTGNKINLVYTESHCSTCSGGMIIFGNLRWVGYQKLVEGTWNMYEMCMGSYFKINNLELRKQDNYINRKISYCPVSWVLIYLTLFYDTFCCKTGKFLNYYNTERSSSSIYRNPHWCNH
jgi:hypothetical protein